jgi:AcrR family transcriptional regulator
MTPPAPSQRRTAIPNAAKRRPAELHHTADRKRRGTGRTSRGRDTRERLVTAAQQVFERDGFLHARIADICAHAGVAQPSFYTYFLSKEEIFEEVVSTIELDMLTMPSRGATTDPIQRIREANRHYLEFYRDNARILAVIDQMATFDDHIKTTRADRHERFARAIEQRIRSHQRAGLSDPRIDAYFAANALGGMVTAMATHLFIHGAPGDIDHAVDQLTLLWTNAIGIPT